LAPDHKADAFQPEVSPPVGRIDSIIRSTLDGFHKWDAKYFVYIAEHGYETENTFAFFPLLPTSCWGIASAFRLVSHVLSFHTCCLLSAYWLNTNAFIWAAVAIYDLTMLVFHDKKFAFLASLCFSCNPASIFFSSCYTESLFALFLFKGLISLLHNKMGLSSLWFALASCTRSNGTINAGFIAFYSLKTALDNKITGLDLIKHFLKHFIYCLIVLVPFCLFNLYGYVKFCTKYYEKDPNISPPVWCNNSLPSIYNYIQKHNWGLGLFEYYKSRKIPNFLLALPVVFLTAISIFPYFLKRYSEIFSLGLPFKGLVNPVMCKNDLIFTSRNLFCFICHLAFLVTFALCFMHVEVVTRMAMSSSPLPYWFTASYLYPCIDDIRFDWNTWKRLSTPAKFVVVYFFSYFFIGTVLHVNFLPWT
uniref:GPI mannosyltransferase 2 n=1 Tax=Ciona savignyi TaxID=51511 RepID=H2YY96_CIOSA